MFYSVVKCTTGKLKAQSAPVERWTCEVRGGGDLKTENTGT